MKKISALGILIALLSIIVLPNSYLAKSGQGFKDIQNHWAKNSINNMYEQGYVKGVSDTKFKPDSEITRAEFITLLSRILNVKDAPNPFADKGKTKWADGSIGGAVEHGIIDIENYESGFEPNKAILRSEMAKMMALGISVENEDYREVLNSFASLNHGDLPFVDSKNVKREDIPYLATAVGTEVIQGNNQFKLNPYEKATRAEATVMLQRYLTVKEKDLSNYLYMNELVEIAETGTNAQTVSHLLPNTMPKQEDIIIEHPNFTATLKRLYVLPFNNNSSLFEQKYLGDRNVLGKINKDYLENIEGYTIGIADVTYKKSGMAFEVLSSKLYFTPSMYFTYSNQAEKFNFTGIDMDMGRNVEKGTTEEIVFFGIYSNEHINISFQANGVNTGKSGYNLLFNPENKYRQNERGE